MFTFIRTEPAVNIVRFTKGIIKDERVKAKVAGKRNKLGKGTELRIE